eukprot:TRINITY_DN67553_c0_g1_i1.p1 TRINITY_DN67553_c0_g1~~TRINITY_DN67553_c0_g1_i1.p1  ORF type:complete len:575 (-),score=109.10 TRINITY_DN67553_c0_g1_i1:118-1842(-)
MASEAWEEAVGLRRQGGPPLSNATSDVLTVFKRFDLNGDGVISREELASVLRAVDPGEWNDEKVDMLLEAACGEEVVSETSRVIKFDQFMSWLNGDDSNWKEARKLVSEGVKTGSNIFSALLGSTLRSNLEDVDTSTALSSKKYIGLYFSAHWCPPCRGFTPVLAKAYTETLQSKDMEIVFLSNDRDESQFETYFAEMPWLALPFNSVAEKMRVGRMFMVRGLPTLVILAADGSCIVRDAVQKVASDLDGFPWLPDPEERERCDMIFDTFDEDHDGFLSLNEMQRLVLTTNGCLPTPLWPVVCAELCVDSSKGLTKEALFRWYTENGGGDINKVHALITDPRKMKRAEAIMAAKEASRLNEGQLMQVFEAYDPERDLTKADFIDLWRKLGFQEELVETYFTALDSNLNGVISFKELLAGLTILSGHDVDATAELLMKVFDTKGTGFLDREEFDVAMVASLKCLKAGMEAALKPIVEALGGVVGLMAAVGGENTEEMPGPEAMITEMMSEFPVADSQTLTESFDQIDGNNDGKLTVEELKCAFKKSDEVLKLLLPQPTVLDVVQTMSSPQACLMQ